MENVVNVYTANHLTPIGCARISVSEFELLKMHYFPIVVILPWGELAQFPTSELVAKECSSDCDDCIVADGGAGDSVGLFWGQRNMSSQLKPSAKLGHTSNKRRMSEKKKTVNPSFTMEQWHTSHFPAPKKNLS